MGGVGDVLLLEGEPEALKVYVRRAELELLGSETLTAASGDIAIVEVIVKPGSRLSGRTPASMQLRTRYGVNILGLARYGRRMQTRLRDLVFQHGDILLLQGEEGNLERAISELGCLPLAERRLGIGEPRRLIMSTSIFAAAIAATLANVLPIHIAFVAAVAALVLLRIIRLDEVYESIDWPVIVLLGAMIPVGTAVELTGGTVTIANAVVDVSQWLPAWWVLAILLVSTMMLSDVINNNATAVLMAPIALTLAERLRVNPDAFLMAVAIGASCAFLTPIGHQSNTLVLAPGGYRFGDYWRMGLPLEIVITLVAMPLLLLIWPL